MAPELWAKIVESIATGGPIAILAFIIFFMYRAEKAEEREKWEAFAKDDLKRRDDENTTRKDLTRALNDLTIAIKTKMS